MARPRKYSDELRRRAVDEVLERGRKIPDVARDLGIGSPEAMRNWVRAGIDELVRNAGSTARQRADLRDSRWRSRRCSGVRFCAADAAGSSVES